MKEMIARVGDMLKQSGIASVCLTGEELVRCKDCEWYSPEISWCNNLMSPKEQTFFCADGKVQGITNRERIVLDECISNKGD